jgi:hypothetical protein
MCDKETKKTFFSCFIANSISHSLHIFPRRPTELFDYYINTEVNYLNEQMKYYVSIKEPYRLRNFRESESTEIPAIPHFDENKKPVKLKERDFYVFENNSFSSEFTVCFLHKDKKSGLYSYFDPMNKSMYDDDFKNYTLRLSVKENKTGRRIFFVYHKEDCSWWPCDTSNPKKFYEYSKRYIAYFKIIFDGNRENKEDPEEKKLVIEAEAVNGNMKKKCELTLTYSTYKGWTLTKEGELKQGGTGWLFDEKGYYILEDGRRVDENILKEKKYKEDEIRVGDKDAGEGFKKILEGGKTEKTNGAETNSLLENIRCKYNVYGDILINHHKKITNLVSMQAFQINVCYATENSARNPIRLGNNVKFYSIGRDEAEIPIVVTLVGSSIANRKLVIAGPHGNERIARFVVLEAQKYFVDRELTKDELGLYFVPAMSPTLFFADARGLPFIKNLNDDVYEIDEVAYKETDITDVNYKNNIQEKLRMGENLSISKLHNLMGTKSLNIDNQKEELVHDLIQGQNNSKKPIYGIDANRDCYNVLKSTEAFHYFITGLGARPYHSAVIMLHGYENANNQKERINNPSLDSNDQGTVLGPYIVETHRDNKDIDIGRITKDVIRRVDFMTSALFDYKFNLKYDFIDSEDPTNMHQRSYFFGGGVTSANVTSFKGEWARKLYGDVDYEWRRIPCFDIELSNSYRDGTRGKKEGGSGTEMNYNPNKVLNRGTLPFFAKENENGPINGKFANKQDKEASTISFFDFLLDYFN